MKRITGLMVAPALALAATQVQAQDEVVPEAIPETESLTPNSVRLGPSFLSQSNTSNLTGRGGFLLGLSRDISERGRVDLDFSRQSRGGSDIQAGGLSYIHRFPFNPDGDNKFYSALGVGVYHVSADFNGSGVTLNDSAVRVGGKVLVGYQFNQRFFTEAGYTKIGKVSGADPSHFSLVVGLRF